MQANKSPQEKCAMKMKKKQRLHKYFLWWKEELIRLYQKNGETDFDKLLDAVSTFNEGTSSLVTSELKPYGWFVVRRCRTSSNSWFSGLMALISSILSISILYGKNALDQ